MASPVDLSDFVAGFLLEAEEHLHSVNRNLVSTAEALTKNLPEPRAVRELFRSLHTIKGLAAMVGAEPIVDVAHEMEGLLRTADRTGGQLSESALDLLLQGTRLIEDRVRQVGKSGVKSLAPIPIKLIEALVLVQSTPPAPRPPEDYTFNLPPEVQNSMSASDREQIIQAARASRRVVLIDFEPSPARAEGGLNITSVRERLAKVAELIKVVPRAAPGSPTGIAFSLLLCTEISHEALTEMTGGAQVSEVVTNLNALPVQPLTAEPAGPLDADLPGPVDWLPTEPSSIRVDVRRLDEALEQLSGLFVTRFKLERACADIEQRQVDTRDLKQILNENARQLKRLRAAISEARMVPLTELLQRLPLVVRGITNDSDKSINVTIHAGTAEVDKAVADKIFPAVVHLVRNAVDHAIESRAERRAAGKPEVGELTILCDDSSGTNLILTITDDGRGVHAEAVARKANRAPAQNDEELLEQICQAGLSTAQGLTRTSGRGMGMDIVKRTVQLLGGALALKTTPGRGTSIEIRVPVTVTIVDVLSFESGGQTYVSPVAIVDEIVEVDPLLAVQLPAGGAHGAQPRLIQYRGRAIPLLVLEALLENRMAESVPRKALVVNRGQGTVAFGIDRMIGKQEAVVRPLEDALVRVVGMAGATDLGDGRPTLVLDLVRLGHAALQNLKAHT